MSDLIVLAVLLALIVSGYGIARRNRTASRPDQLRSIRPQLVAPPHLVDVKKRASR